MPEPAAHRITADAVGRGAVDPGEPHDHGACIEDALTAAGRVCAERGTQLTALRRRVLELIWASHKSVKAYDLLHRQIGRASCRERVWKYVYMSGVAVSLNKKKSNNDNNKTR